MDSQLFPTSVVGSLPRPEWLIDGIAKFEKGELDGAQLEQYYD